MGIDLFLRWDGMSQAEKKAQYTAVFSLVDGHLGYLRESYHGGPYAIAILISEDWDKQPEGGFTIPVAKLKKRLSATVMTAINRAHIVYGSWLYQPPRFNFKDKKDVSELIARLIEPPSCGVESPPPKSLRAVSKLIKERQLPDYALAFVNFVELAECKEKQTGKPCQLLVSW